MEWGYAIEHDRRCDNGVENTVSECKRENSGLYMGIQEIPRDCRCPDKKQGRSQQISWFDLESIVNSMNDL